MMDKEETTGLERVYSFLVDFITENTYSPSIREICEGANVSSKASVHDHLRKLKMMGKIDMKENTARTITLIGYRLVRTEEN